MGEWVGHGLGGGNPLVEYETDQRGRLLTWLGPAICGTLAWAVKEAVCRWPPAQRDSQYQTCRGYPHAANCPYGSAFETELGAKESGPYGLSDGQRAITIRPPFSAPQYAHPGDRLILCWTFLGQQAAAASEAIAEILAAPQCPLALGSDRIAFRLSPHGTDADAPGARQEVEPWDLPPSPRSCPGRVPAVRVDLTTPLFLKETRAESDKARAYIRATAAREFENRGASVCRIRWRLGRAGRFRGPEGARRNHPHPCGLLATLPPAIPQQPTPSELRPGGRDRGSGLRLVPLCLIPWMVWGGRLGIGEHRVAGAGCWQVTLLA